MWSAELSIHASYRNCPTRFAIFTAFRACALILELLQLVVPSAQSSTSLCCSDVTNNQLKLLPWCLGKMTVRMMYENRPKLHLHALAPNSARSSTSPLPLQIGQQERADQLAGVTTGALDSVRSLAWTHISVVP